MTKAMQVVRGGTGSESLEAELFLATKHTYCGRQGSSARGARDIVERNRAHTQEGGLRTKPWYTGNIMRPGDKAQPQRPGWEGWVLHQQPPNAGSIGSLSRTWVLSTLLAGGLTPKGWTDINADTDSHSYKVSSDSVAESCSERVGTVAFGVCCGPDTEFSVC